MNNEIDIHMIRSRPRFKVVAEMTEQDFSEMLNKHLKDRNKVLSGYSNSEIAVIKVRQDADKYWAPQLQIRIEKSEEIPNAIEIRGIFGPRATIWTLFMFSYGLGSAILLTTGLYGWVELALGIGKTWVWSNLVGTFLIITPYILAKIGQSIAKGHMGVLRTFIERVLIEEKIIQG
ncbi:MAG: hypothetical protein ACK5IC_03150 [Moheibacter sp.]